MIELTHDESTLSRSPNSKPIPRHPADPQITIKNIWLEICVCMDWLAVMIYLFGVTRRVVKGGVGRGGVGRRHLLLRGPRAGT